MLYVGISGKEKGVVVDEDLALAYAMTRCGILNGNLDAPESDEFRRMLVEWFFSGNWKAVGA